MGKGHYLPAPLPPVNLSVKQNTLKLIYPGDKKKKKTENKDSSCFIYVRGLRFLKLRLSKALKIHFKNCICDTQWQETTRLEPGNLVPEKKIIIRCED